MSGYLVVIEKADGNYSAYSPDLPGCAVTADTKDEALQLMREAIAMHIEGLKKDGLPIQSASRRERMTFEEILGVAAFQAQGTDRNVVGHGATRIEVSESSGAPLFVEMRVPKRQPVPTSPQ